RLPSSPLIARREVGPYTTRTLEPTSPPAAQSSFRQARDLPRGLPCNPALTPRASLWHGAVEAVDNGGIRRMGIRTASLAPLAAALVVPRVATVQHASPVPVAAGR